MTKRKIVVNDVLDELREENARLSDELSFANKCVALLLKYKCYLYDCYINKDNQIDCNDNQLRELENQFNLLLIESKSKSSVELICNDNEIIGDNQQNIDNEEINNCDEYSNSNGELRKPSEMSLEEKYLIISAIDSRGKKTKTEIAKQFNISFPNLWVLYRDREKWIDCYKTSTEEERKREIKLADVNNKTNSSDTAKVDRNASKASDKQNNSFAKKTYDHNLQTLTPKPRKRKQYRCDWIECDFTTDTKCRLKYHKNKHLGVTPFKCADCGKAFYGKDSMRLHKQIVHETVKRFACNWPNCTAMFKLNSTLMRHMQTHTTPHSQKPYACDYPNCNYRALQRINVRQHKYVHLPEKQFKCQVCGKTFKLESTMRGHYYSHDAKPHYTCDWPDCGFGSRSSLGLKLHKARHKNIDTFVHHCDWPGCDYKSERSESLIRHKFVHTNERKIMCSWPSCEKKFKTRKHLSEHVKIHVNDKRHKCQWPGCEYSSVHRSNMKKHFKIHYKNAEMADTLADTL